MSDTHDNDNIICQQNWKVNEKKTSSVYVSSEKRIALCSACDQVWCSGNRGTDNQGCTIPNVRWDRTSSHQWPFVVFFAIQISMLTLVLILVLVRISQVWTRHKSNLNANLILVSRFQRWAGNRVHYIVYWCSGNMVLYTPNCEFTHSYSNNMLRMPYDTSNTGEKHN